MASGERRGSGEAPAREARQASSQERPAESKPAKPKQARLRFAAALACLCRQPPLCSLLLLRLHSQAHACCQEERRDWNTVHTLDADEHATGSIRIHADTGSAVSGMEGNNWHSRLSEPAAAHSHSPVGGGVAAGRERRLLQLQHQFQLQLAGTCCLCRVIERIAVQCGKDSGNRVCTRVALPRGSILTI